MSDISKASIQLSVWRMHDMEDRCIHVACRGGDAMLAELAREGMDENVGIPEIFSRIVAADVLLLALNTADGLAAPASRLIPLAGLMGAASVLVVLADGEADPESESRFQRCRDEVLEWGRVWRISSRPGSYGSRLARWCWGGCIACAWLIRTWGPLSRRSNFGMTCMVARDGRPEFWGRTRLLR